MKSSFYLGALTIMVSRATSEKLKRGIFRMLALILLVLYVAGTSELEIIHSFFHNHDHTVSHSEEQEQDPCHRLIYHGDIQQGCDHDSHLIVSDKCHMCDLAFHGDQMWVGIISEESGKYENKFFSLYTRNLDTYGALILPSRAPPTLI